MYLCDRIGKSDQNRAAWALTGFATTQGIAIRNLALSGLDSPARQLSRSYVEALTYCIVCLRDQKLASRFVAAQTPEAALSLWSKELRGSTLGKKFSAAIGQLDARVQEPAQEFLEWLTSTKRDFSQPVHASYLASFMACLPRDAETRVHRTGLFGLATIYSVRTLETLAKATWFFSRMLVLSMLDGVADWDKLSQNSEDEVSTVVVSGLYVLGELMNLYWDTNASKQSEPNSED